jgi:iron complex outermembrane receptor protein
MYGKVGQTVKAGGFVFSGTLASADLAEYDDETATGYELGFKSTMLDGRLRFNAALFYTNFDDLQVSSFNTPPNSAPILVVSNAGSSTSSGLEMDLDFAATEWLTVGGSIGFLNSEFDEYADAPCSLEEKFAGATVCDKSGQVTPYAPDYSGSLYADLSFPMGSNLEIFGGIVMSFSDSYFTEASLAASGEQDSYTKWDARIGLTRADNKWSVSLIGKNLSEEAINGMGVPFAGMIGFLGAPRTIMLQGTLNY